MLVFVQLIKLRIWVKKNPSLSPPHEAPKIVVIWDVSRSEREIIVKVGCCETVDYCDSLILSMPRHIKTVITSK